MCSCFHCERVKRDGRLGVEGGARGCSPPAWLPELSHRARSRGQERRCWAITAGAPVDIKCNSRQSPACPSCLFFLSPFLIRQSAERTTPPASTPTARPATTRKHTHIPTERDGSVTIGKQRLLVTENALRRESRRQSGGEEVVGLHRTWTERAQNRFLPPATPPPLPNCSKKCPDLQGLQEHG